MAHVLVTGMAGGLSRLVAQRLLALGHQVVGADYRPLPAPLPDGMPFYQANYNKTRIEDIFKRHKVDSVLHLGRVGNLKESMGKRFDLNVVGSQKIMNLCLQHGVKRLVVLSTFHIYGAHPANHIPIYEDEPLRAGTNFPQLADAIQLDNMACQWVYQHRKVRTVVVRPTNVVGPLIHNTMSQFLRLRYIPHLAGFNPMTQFIYQDDLADAVVAAHEGDAAGVFNLTGDAVVPWRTALKLVKADTFPLPAPLVSGYLRLISGFPQYLMNFFLYPCVISDRAFREKFPWRPQVSLQDALWRTVEETRRAQGAA
ncbi:MAG: NAD-dependent epimerase/dehydratase family protein [Myxococcota bacterium]